MIFALITLCAMAYALVVLAVVTLGRAAANEDRQMVRDYRAHMAGRR